MLAQSSAYNLPGTLSAYTALTQSQARPEGELAVLLFPIPAGEMARRLKTVF